MAKNNSHQKYSLSLKNKGPEFELAKEVINRLVKDDKLDRDNRLAIKAVGLQIVNDIFSNSEIFEDIYKNNGKIFDANREKISDALYEAFVNKTVEENYSPTIRLSDEWKNGTEEIKTSLEKNERKANYQELKDNILSKDIFSKGLDKTFEEGKKISQNIENNLKNKKEENILGKESKQKKILGLEEVIKKDSNFKFELENIKKEFKQAFKTIKNEIKSHLPGNSKVQDERKSRGK